MYSFSNGTNDNKATNSSITGILLNSHMITKNGIFILNYININSIECLFVLSIRGSSTGLKEINHFVYVKNRL